ncbi:hypothetical protein OF83DRAFT_1095380 [Amylostereum chailletii]|nr:hypothetical protein OF83DRAFT_1095380 [Amylostereum chailletii]
MAKIPTQLTFFDIPTQASIPTSPNTWKLRLALNYKRLDYTTHWTPTSLAETTCIAHGIPPSSTRADGTPHYTLPALIDHTVSPPVRLSDSTRIIDYLERTYPTPGHHIQHRLKPPFYDLFTLALYDSKLPVDQKDYVKRKTREKSVGTLQELQVNDPEGRAAAWRRFREAFRLLAQVAEEGEAYYRALPDGSPKKEEGNVSDDIPLFHPPAVTYSDLALGALLIELHEISPEDGWKEVSTWDGGRWARLREGLQSRWGYVEEMQTDF